ncbi:MAG: NAD-dependent epimerase/dehydratase [Candidatus Gottesmanbacteria bacterium GW2011_GWA2_43_14]|uniref:NAD-dependent epimerase/dehydratase n=1 Tax=Candidatus Gottesmanbacteria bacterium GW2011_GWA2_43_14 TaxID=1618443 RepID=A0A0G1DED3_9BACT|nr:MAG: NAD-dependent epimerase/dehydratase [Candidatus Gottesmanbacteria bacterium GW2011_GWA2_43_14]
MKKILVTGAFGLVGSDLVVELGRKYGHDNVVLLAHETKRQVDFPLEKGDVRDKSTLAKIIKKYNVGQIYHLAGLLSVGGEKNPPLAWDININGLRNVLDLAVNHKCRLFWPSSIAVFGPTTPRDKTPQHTVLEPTTMYGVTKLAGELLCQYYFLKYGLDVRSLRYPGLIAYKAPPGDGTTEYSVHIFYGALKNKSYSCFLKKGTVLPMMFITDAVTGTIGLMEADPGKISVRTSYNFSAINFAPEELVLEIKKHMPEFKCSYKPDHRQKIADSWPKSIDDAVARKDWGWRHEYNLPRMTTVMLEKLKEKLSRMKSG